MLKLWPVLFVLSVLAACTQYSLVDAQRVKIGNAYSVDPQIAWSKLQVGDFEIWTVDGANLEALQFHSGIETGDTLYERADDEDLPVFDADMKPNEVMEFVVDSLARQGANDIKTSGLRPTEFGQVRGYRFQFAFQTNDGLQMRGLATGTVMEDELHLILYMGASTYYFEKYLDQVERIFASIQTIEA
jgi:hypothetical protein